MRKTDPSSRPTFSVPPLSARTEARHEPLQSLLHRRRHRPDAARCRRSGRVGGRRPAPVPSARGTSGPGSSDSCSGSACSPSCNWAPRARPGRPIASRRIRSPPVSSTSSQTVIDTNQNTTVSSSDRSTTSSSGATTPSTSISVTTTATTPSTSTATTTVTSTDTTVTTATTPTTPTTSTSPTETTDTTTTEPSGADRRPDPGRSISTRETPSSDPASRRTSRSSSRRSPRIPPAPRRCRPSPCPSRRPGHH